MTEHDETGIRQQEALGEITTLMKQSRDWNFIWQGMSPKAQEQFRERVQEKRIRDSLEIIRLFTENNIQFIVLKGLTLQFYHKNRRFDDLDLYVPGDDFERAVIVLETRGYIADRQDVEDKQKGNGISHHIVFHKANRICVELHYRLFYNTSTIEEKLPVMEEVIFLDIRGITVPSLSKELQFLGLFLHNFYNHRFLDYFKKMFEDAECLLQDNDLDWDKFLTCVNLTGYHELLFRIITLLNVFNEKKIRIPDSVLRELQRNSSYFRVHFSRKKEILFYQQYCEFEKLPPSPEKEDLIARLDWKIKYYLLFSLGCRSDFFRLLRTYNLFSADTLRRLVR